MNPITETLGFSPILGPQACTPVEMLNVQIGEHTYSVYKGWWDLIQLYQVPVEIYGKKVFSIGFVAGTAKITSHLNGFQMVFSSPLTYRPGFRFVPCLPCYAVSSKGVVLDVRTGEEISHSYSGGEKEYVKVNIEAFGNKEKRYVALHRLIAAAWVRNPDPVMKIYVNHIDGDKTNISVNNLEWVTMYENNKHAVLAGLREDNIRCKVRDFYTGEVTRFACARDMAFFMNVVPRNAVAFFERAPWRLVNKRYEVKREEDDSPWYYEGKTEVEAIAWYTIVAKKDGEDPIVFNGGRDFKEWIRPYTGGDGLPHLLKHARRTKPEYTFEVIDNRPTFEVQIRNAETLEVSDFKTPRDAALHLGLKTSRVKFLCRLDRRDVFHGHQFRIKSEEPWPDPSEHQWKPQCIEIQRVSDGVTLQFASLRELAAHLGVDRSTLKRRLKTGLPYGDWTIQLKPDPGETLD